MKIAVNAQFLNKHNTGSGQYLINLLNILLKIDRENEYILYLENKTNLDFSDSLSKVKIKIVKVPFYTRDDLIRKTLWEKFVFPKAVKSAKGGSAYGGKDKPDLVWSPYFSSSKISGIKHIMTVHDVIYKVFPQYVSNWRWKMYYNLAESAVKAADKIITISQCSKRDIMKFLNIKESKIKTIYLGKPDDKNFEFRISNFEINKKYILYLGGFDYRKNVVKLIEAYKIFCEPSTTDLHQQRSVVLGELNNNINLVIAGKLPKQPNPIAPDVDKKVKESGLQDQDRVQFIGYAADENLPELYKNAGVFVFPTLYEGFGLPVLEAMSYGCPVITSNNSSILEIAGDAAFLIDPDNTQDIANAITKVVSDRELRQRMIQKGLENAQRFSWEKCAKETLEVFNSLK